MPRVMRDVSEIDLRTEILGCDSALPIALAPTGLTRAIRDGGERDVARAASAAGVPYAVSTMSSTPLEDVAAASQGPLWFQLYMLRDRGLSREIVTRARDAGYRALLVGADAPTVGGRERDTRNGFTMPPAIGARTIIDGLRHPAWTSQFLGGRLPAFAHIPEPMPRRTIERSSSLVDPSLRGDPRGGRRRSRPRRCASPPNPSWRCSPTLGGHRAPADPAVGSGPRRRPIGRRYPAARAVRVAQHRTRGASPAETGTEAAPHAPITA
ncbi:L-lactate dehydrogenase [Capillimicrobium parvum]|uniref:L-lactate dehydrogenase n=1 Tax=Capillimicrobium parvum TaxID=2884022 RepID=A0A9E6XZ32_9ACTN|nr:L-lactate dehydrogenase [Capillimicrobium parvum]